VKKGKKEGVEEKKRERGKVRNEKWMGGFCDEWML
jgi:hypothetical protein